MNEIVVPPRRAPNEVTNKLDDIARMLGDGEESYFLLTLSALFDKFPQMTVADIEKLSN